MKQKTNQGKSCQYRQCHRRAIHAGKTLNYCIKHWNWYVRVNNLMKVKALDIPLERDVE
jgi:hypothetical protein